MKLLSLCTGYGGLDMAVEAYFDAELIGCSDINKASDIAIKINLKVPNYGDLRNLIGTDLKFDILTAGYPCQPFSHAGHRKGTNDERHIWPYIAQIIGHSRPSIIILENVRGHLSLGFKEVLKDLAELGYAARWTVVRASDVGAPHQRARLFILAYPNSSTRRISSSNEGTSFTNPNSIRSQISVKGQQSSQQQPSSNGQIGITSNANCSTCDESRRANRRIHGTTGEIINGSDRDEHRCCNQISGNTKHEHQSHDRQMSRLGRRFATRCEMSMQTAPDPLVDGKLSAKFVEYMMGLPEGWVTDLPISRNQQLMMLGNGVVPQQAYYALELLCEEMSLS